MDSMLSRSRSYQMDRQSANYQNMAHQLVSRNRPDEFSVLLLDPSEEYRKKLEHLFSSNGYTVLTASNVGEAMDIIVRHSPGVMFTEILFDDIDSVTVLRSLRKLDKDLVMIIYTTQPERRIGPNRRLEHIFEFIVKPSTSFELIGHLKRAYSFHREKTSLKEYVNETRERIRRQLEWLIWTERALIDDRVQYSKSIVDSIKHTTTQGNGIGSMITLVDMINMDKSEESDDRFSISAQLMNKLIDNASAVRHWLDELDIVSRSLGNNYEIEIISGQRVIEMVNQMVQEMEPFRQIKGHAIRVDRDTFDQPVESNEMVISLALKELITNSFKFSPDNSVIRIKFNRTSDSFSVLIMNKITPMTRGITGIPIRLEQKIFEPFFKLNNIHDDRFQYQMFGMGTGLTVIQGAINQIGGKIYVYEADDPDERDVMDKRIVAEVIFPIHQPQNESELEQLSDFEQ